MIEVFDKERENEFHANIDDGTRKRVSNSRAYVVRTKADAFLLSFRWVDGSKVVILADDENCSVMTENSEVVKFTEGIDEPTGLQELFMLFLALTEDDVEVLENLEDKIFEMEEMLFSDRRPEDEGFRMILKYRKEVLVKKRYYEQMEIITDELAGLDHYFDFIDKRLDRIYQGVLRLQEYVEQVREAYQSQIDIEQNNIMKFFTVATTLIMPLTLITGWYGMNLIIPEFKWHYGYPVVIGLSVAVVCIMLYVFKKKKWL